MNEFYQTNFYIILGIMAAAAFGLTLLFGRIALPILREGDHVLFKASRSMALEPVVEVLIAGTNS